MKETVYRKKLRNSISFKLPLLFVVFGLLLTTILLSIVYFRLKSQMIDEYSKMAEGATYLMSLEIDADKTDEYLEKNFEMDEYNRILDRFYDIKQSYPDILYMYVYRIQPDGGHVIFDLNSDGLEDADAPGDIYELDEAFEKNIDALCAGEPTPAMTGETEDGYLLTYCRPLKDSKGNYQCHVCVDFSMEHLRKKDLAFINGMIAIIAASVISALFIVIFIIRRKVTVPLDSMSKATSSFSYETADDHKHNITIMEDLKIKTNDEIEDLYNIFITVMKQNLRYMNKLSKAQDDIRSKDERIGQISMKVFKDELTHVGNKAAFNCETAELDEEIGNNLARFAIVMLDANNLKYINDNFGHKAGDKYIQGCCTIVCKKFQRSPVFRIGGDEFVVVLKNYDYENRQRLIDEIIEQFTQTYENTEAEPHERYSMSIGMAEFNKRDKNCEQVLKRADEAMYEYKKAFKKKHGSYR